MPFIHAITPCIYAIICTAVGCLFRPTYTISIQGLLNLFNTTHGYMGLKPFLVPLKRKRNSCIFSLLIITSLFLYVSLRCKQDSSPNWSASFGLPCHVMLRYCILVTLLLMLLLPFSLLFGSFKPTAWAAKASRSKFSLKRKHEHSDVRH